MAVAQEIIESGLYETLQYPFSYLSSEKEIALVRACVEKDMGFICMKALAGGLVTRSDAAMAYMTQFDNLVPIWGIQRENELREWLSYMENTPAMTGEIADYIKGEQDELAGDFCRGCGYCLPCPMGIEINNCARMSLMVRRAPSASWLSEAWQEKMAKIENCINCRQCTKRCPWLSEAWQEKMAKIENCINCRQCTKRCPYELDTPELLRRNLADYKRILAGEITV